MTINAKPHLRLTEERSGVWPLLEPGGIKRFLSERYATVLFALIFFLPTLAATLHYGLIASDRYISESKFIVRGVNGNQVGGLSVILRTFGISRSNDDSYAIESFVTSREALQKLNENFDIAAMYRRPESDFLTGYYSVFTTESFEGLYAYYQNQVELVRDLESGITTLKVSAFRAEDAKSIADALLRLGEQRVNEMNERNRQDTLRLSQATLQDVEGKLLKAQLDVTHFRNAELIVDAKKTASGNVELLTAILIQLADEEVNLRQMVENSPSNPAIAAQTAKVDALKKQAALEQAKIAGPDEAIAGKLGKYEQLLLYRKLAESAYEAATQSMDRAREEARRKQIYLEPIVAANLPDKSLEPRRIRSIFTIALLTFSSFVMIYLLVSGSREHLNLH